jgi:starch synthase
MRVLYCVSECAPIIKVGGLGDVAGSLPKALEALGVEVTIIVPHYKDVNIFPGYGLKTLKEIKLNFAGKEEIVFLHQTILPDSRVKVYLLASDTYFSSTTHQAFTGTEDEVERFSFFSKAIATIIKEKALGWEVDLVHLNDWHTSLVSLLLPEQPKIPSVLTIHNLAYQGVASLELLTKINVDPKSCLALKWDIENRDIDILMEGIIHATLINTVSPTYAKEIMTPQFGRGIEEVLKGREGKVFGILNGIDYQVWDPSTDKMILSHFSLANFQSGKAINKKKIQEELRLLPEAKVPLLAFIGRLEPKQKGLDILFGAMESLLASQNFHFIILGVGDKGWEEKFRLQSLKFKDKMVFVGRFDEGLAHQLYAGADVILVPSLFEPCGLPQMIGMRYGVIPLVRKTGGLADSVENNKTGFVFENYSASALAATIRECLRVYQESQKWQQLISHAMEKDFSWERSAQKYLELYQKVIEANG